MAGGVELLALDGVAGAGALELVPDELLGRPVGVGDRAEVGRYDEFLGLAEACWRTRAYGDFWSYMLLAEGAVDIAAEPELEVHDMAALVPIVTEAGGRFTSLDGTPGPWGGNAVATNGILHDEVLARIGTRSVDPAPEDD